MFIMAWNSSRRVLEGLIQTERRDLRCVPVSVDISPQHGVHPRQMPWASRPEPINDVAVETKMHGSLARRHDDAGLFPKVLPERFRLGSIGSRLIFAARAWL